MCVFQQKQRYDDIQLCLFYPDPKELLCSDTVDSFIILPFTMPSPFLSLIEAVNKEDSCSETFNCVFSNCRKRRPSPLCSGPVGCINISGPLRLCVDCRSSGKTFTFRKRHLRDYSRKDCKIQKNLMKEILLGNQFKIIKHKMMMIR